MSVGLARHLRRRATDAERLLWSGLRDHRLGGLGFRRQQPIDGFVVDFVCFEKRLIVEVDGGQHGPQTDRVRTDYLIGQGFRVLRFWNSEIMQNFGGVLETILAASNDPDFVRDA